MSNKLKSFNFKGVITSTSDKQSDKFKQDEDQQRKSVFISTDEENAKILIEHGLTQYTSKEDNVPFFIVKAARNVKAYEKGKKEVMETISGMPNQSMNFSTNGEVDISCVVGENMGNAYVRVSAIQVTTKDQIEYFEAQNPFE